MDETWFTGFAETFEVPSLVKFYLHWVWMDGNALSLLLSRHLQIEVFNVFAVEFQRRTAESAIFVVFKPPQLCELLFYKCRDGGDDRNAFLLHRILVVDEHSDDH